MLLKDCCTNVIINIIYYYIKYKILIYVSVMSTEIGNISCISVICRKILMIIYNYPKEVTYTPLREMLPMLLDNTVSKEIKLR